MSKQTISLDFDGVIHSYASGWAGYVPTDPPVRGAREAIARMRELGFRVVVHSSRCAMQEGIHGVRAWLEQHGIEVDDVSRDKPQAVLIVDDRGLRFEGDWRPVLERIERGDFSPWNKKPCQPCGVEPGHGGVHHPGCTGGGNGRLDEKIGDRIRVLCYDAAGALGWPVHVFGDPGDVFVELIHDDRESSLVHVKAEERERLAQLIAPMKFQETKETTT